MKNYFLKTLLFALAVTTHAQAADQKPGYSDLLKTAQASDWQDIPQENLLYMQLASGTVIIELAPDFAPNHVANIKMLAHEAYWDGLAIVRAQDNYVVQWADPNDDKPEKKRKIKQAKETLPAEFERSAKGLMLTKLPDKDVYAPEVGFVGDFPVARDAKKGLAWMVHCYGTVGVGRDVAADSGGGTELYAVIGHSPRHLDRNITLVGHVVRGMDLLSTLPRGTGPLGFYEKENQYTPIQKVRLGTELDKKDQVQLQSFRTSSPLFQKLIQAKRSREEDWFKFKAGRLEICNMPVPVRDANAPEKKTP